MKNLTPYISDTLPGFISTDHPTFKYFIEAYYEWMEKQNTTDSETTAKTIYKKLKNPGAVVNNADIYRDVDETVDQFLQYFKNEIIPIAIDGSRFKDNKSAVGDRFFIKKIRDVYLSKGTPKAFELLFRMLYNEDIEIFQTGENVLEASEGKYINFPLISVEVLNDSQISQLNFTLAQVFKGNDSVALTLGSSVIGSYNDKGVTRSILSVQLNNQIANLNSSDVLKIVDPTDPQVFIDVKVLNSLSSLDVNDSDNGGGYQQGDKITIKSKKYNKSFIAIVDSVKSGTVDKLHVRNRGEFYSVGDSIGFSTTDSLQGSGGLATVTAVDKNGRMLEIDGIPLRTPNIAGDHNGYLADNFEDVTIPITNGGAWKAFPTVNISSVTKLHGSSNLSGQGAQITAASNSIGSIAKVNIVGKGFFDSDGDVEVIAPMNINFERKTSFVTGETVSFQRFVPNLKSRGFTHDSETVNFTIKFKRPITTAKTFNLPYSFDLNYFQWNKRTYSSSTIADLKTKWDNDVKTSLPGWKVDSQNTTELKVLFHGGYLDALDSYHFNQLNQFIHDDSDVSITWTKNTSPPNLGTDSDIGNWVNTNYLGIINGVGHNGHSVSVLPYLNNPFPQDSDLIAINKTKNTLLRLVVIDPETKQTVVGETLPLSNIIAVHNRAKFKSKTSPLSLSQKSFINEDGFLNSESGGVLQDGLFYSNFTYIIQSKIPIANWRESIKTMLHPAGMLMLAELNIDSVAQYISPTTAEVFNTTENTQFTFDAMQDRYEAAVNVNNIITADNTYYETNASEVFMGASASSGLRASYYQTTVNELTAAQKGNSWWDYEPVGLVKKEYIKYDADISKVVNAKADSERIYSRNITTQTINPNDSDNFGNKVIANYKKYYKKFDGTYSDLYKTDNRNHILHQSSFIGGVSFSDPVNEKYSVYDSDFPYTTQHTYLRWSDSETIDPLALYTFKSIDYSQLKKRNSKRILKTSQTKRKREISIDNNKDFNLAMRENGSLTFVDGGVTYKDFDAYERKWNTFNSQRTIDSDNWQINGWTSAYQNIKHAENPRLRYTNTRVAKEIQPEKSNIKTPLKYSSWNTRRANNDSDVWWWSSYYGRKINNWSTDNFERFIFDKEDLKPTFWDPKHSMRNRRG